jgi:hypothetical protein
MNIKIVMIGRPMSMRVVLPSLSVQSKVRRLKPKLKTPNRSANSSVFSAGIPASRRELEKNA